MTPAQKSLYWRTWRAVRKTLVELGGFSDSDADEERHKIHRESLGVDKSSAELSNADFDRILDGFRAYLVIESGPVSGPSRSDSQPRKRLLFAIRQLGFSQQYLAEICRDQYGHEEWESLPMDSLEKLRCTATARSRSKRKKTAEK